MNYQFQSIVLKTERECKHLYITFLCVKTLLVQLYSSFKQVTFLNERGAPEKILGGFFVGPRGSRHPCMVLSFSIIVRVSVYVNVIMSWSAESEWTYEWQYDYEYKCECDLRCNPDWEYKYENEWVWAWIWLSLIVNPSDGISMIVSVSMSIRWVGVWFRFIHR